MDAIEKSLVSACEKDFGKDVIIDVSMDRMTGIISVFQKKEVVEEVFDDTIEMSVERAKAIDSSYELGDFLSFEVTPKDFGRIAAQKARSIIVQAIKEGERDAIFDYFACKERDIITGVVQKYVGNNISISLDEKTDTVLSEADIIPGEFYRHGDRIKLYVSEVKKKPKGFKITVTRTHPDLVKRLFEKEVSEVCDGTVEIKSISREAGSRTKIAVWSKDSNVDPVGACVGLNGTRVNNIVDDLKGEKIDIITWDEDPAKFIENALSPSKVVYVNADPKDKTAKVIVPDYQLSLAIGKEGQNARLAARLTGYKIDIKSETQARDLGYNFETKNNLYQEEYLDFNETDFEQE